MYLIQYFAGLERTFGNLLRNFRRILEEFSTKKDKINHNFSVSTILDIGRSILDTFWHCEKFRDLGFRSILDTIFSRRVLTPIWTWKKSASNHLGKPFLRPPVPKRQYPFGNNTFQKKASLILIIYRTRSLVNPYQLKPASQQPSFQLQLLLL